MSAGRHYLPMHRGARLSCDLVWLLLLLLIMIHPRMLSGFLGVRWGARFGDGFGPAYELTRDPLRDLRRSMHPRLMPDNGSVRSREPGSERECDLASSSYLSPLSHRARTSDSV